MMNADGAARAVAAMCDRESRATPCAGFALVEVLVAAICVATMAASVAVIASLVTQTLLASRRDTTVTMLAARVMETLKDQTRRSVSPGGSLDHDEPGFVEYADARGLPLPPGSPSTAAVFTCRWTAEALAGTSPAVIRLQVAAAPTTVWRAANDAVRTVGQSVVLLDFVRERVP